VPHLYAVLDAARPWGALGWLRQAGLAYQCLFEGQKALELAEEAPYLVHLSDDVRRLAQLVNGVWPDHGGLFIASPRPFYDVRRQLRRFLLVKNQDNKVLYFRYYDPRVAAPFLPTCDATQIRTVFGQAIEAYFYRDDEDGSLVEARVATADDGTLRVETHRRLTPQ
jgi:hypothetical protein